MHNRAFFNNFYYNNEVVIIRLVKKCPILHKININCFNNIKVINKRHVFIYFL
jgi:hypothetical protein